MDADVEREIVREIWMSIADYTRALRLAFPTGLDGGPLQFRASRNGVELEIELQAGPQIKLGLLSRPSMTARLRFLGGDVTARKAMLRHMDLAMFSGGG